MTACVGCGYCCSKAPCALGAARFGVELPRLGVMDLAPTMSPCEALIWDEAAGRHWCRLVRDAQGSEKRHLTEGLAIGAGCCSPLFNTWRRDLKDRTHEGST